MIICLMHREFDKLFSISLIQTWLISSVNLNIQQSLKYLYSKHYYYIKNVVIHLFTPQAPVSENSPPTKATAKIDHFIKSFWD